MILSALSASGSSSSMSTATEGVAIAMVARACMSCRESWASEEYLHASNKIKSENCLSAGNSRLVVTVNVGVIR